MSVLPNQTNSTPNDAFFWTVTASTITAKTFSSDRVLTDLLSTGTLITGSISTGGSVVISGDITASNLTVADTTATYFMNSQFGTIAQGFTVSGTAQLQDIDGNTASFSTFMNAKRSNISTIQTTQVVLDGNTLDTAGAGVGAVLLLNGIPIVTTSTSISSLVEWSYYPMLSTVQGSGNNIVGVTNFQGDSASLYDATIANQLVVGTNLYGNLGHFSNLSSGILSAGSFESLSVSTTTLKANTATIGGTVTVNQVDVTTLNATNVTSATYTTTAGGSYTGTTGTFGTVNTGTLNVSGPATFSSTTRPDFQKGINSAGANNFNNQSLDNCPNINTQGSQSMNITSANGLSLTAPTQILLTVDTGSNVINYAPIRLLAKNGNRGQISFTSEPGFGGLPGEVNVTANGGSVLGYGTGGFVNIQANRGTSLLGVASYSRIGMRADSITSYASGYAPITGVDGYNFINGGTGVNICAQAASFLPNFGGNGSVFLYGGNLTDLGNSGGTKVQNGLSADFIQPLPDYLQRTGEQYDLTIKGNQQGLKVRLSNVTYIWGEAGKAYGFNEVESDYLLGTYIYVGNTLGPTSGTIQGMTGNEVLRNFALVSSSAFKGDIGYITFISTATINADQLINVSTINGYTVSQLISSVTPPQFVSTVSTFSELFTSSLQAVNISTIGIQALSITGVSSISGYSIAELVSSVSPAPSATSTFNQLYTSSLQAENVSTIGLQAQQINSGNIYSNGALLLPLISSFTDVNTSSLQANSISTSLLTLSTINGYPIATLVNQPVTSTFLQIFVSDATIFDQTTNRFTVSTINGYNINQFIEQQQLSTVSTFVNLFTSSLQTSTVQAYDVSTLSIEVSSINGYGLSQLINPPLVSTFNQFYTSSLQTNNISANTASILSLTGVSTIDGYTLSQFLSSVSPAPPQISSFLQVFTSSLAVNTITNYQTTFLDLNSPLIAIHADTSINLIADQCNVTISSSNIVENSAFNHTIGVGNNYSVTAVSNVSINASNTLSIYNTNTAPIVGSNDLYILGQGNTTLAGQNNLNLSGILDVNITGTTLLAQTSAVQFQVPTGAFVVNATNMPLVGTTAISLNTNSNINFFSLSTITTSAVSTINTVPATWFSGDIRAATFNGAPLPTSAVVTSTFNQLYAYQLSNNPTIGSGAMGILAATQIDITAPTIQANASDYLLFASNCFTQSSNTRLQGSNTIAIYNGALPTVAAGGIAIQATNNLNLSSPTVQVYASSNIQFLTPSTICSGDIRAATFNGAPLPTSGGGNITSTFNQLYAYQLSNNPTIGSGAMGILAATQIDITAPTIQANASDYLLFASNCFTQSSNTRLQGSNTIAIYNGALPTVAAGGIAIQATNNLNLSSPTVQVYASSNIQFLTPSTICSGDIRAVTFNGAPLPTSSVLTSTFTQLNTRILSNNPVYGNDLLIRAANAIVLDTPSGATSISLGASLDVMGTSGATNIYSQEFNTLNTNIGFTAYNTISLLATSNTSITGQSSISITSSNIELGADNNINIVTPTINIGGSVNTNCNAISNVGQFNRFLISTDLSQPVIQYEYVSTAAAFSGTVTVTLPQRYTSVSSYIPFANITNDATTTLYVNVITRATFEIGWSGYTGFSDIVFSWNTMGT